MLEYSRLDNERRVALAIAWMNDHLREGFRLEEAAGAAAVSPFYFSRVFKEITGLTPLSYFRRLRVLEADRLLQDDPGQPLTELALALGYSSSSVLTREFKTWIGHAPRVCKDHLQTRRRGFRPIESKILQIDGNIREAAEANHS